MDEITELLTSEKKEKKFKRNMLAYLRRSNYEVKVRSDFFYTLSNGKDTVDMDLSSYCYEYSDKPSDTVFDNALAAVAALFQTLDRMDTFTNGQDFIRFIAMPPEKVSGNMITDDFPGDIKKVLCYTSDNMHAHVLSPDYQKKWDVPREVLFSVADRNMAKLFRTVKYRRFKAGDHECAEFYSDGNDFIPSLMMCSGFYEFVSAMIGERFLLCIPSSASFLVISKPAGSEIAKISNEVWDENRSSADPITSAMYLFTPKKVEVIPPPEFIR